VSNQGLQNIKNLFDELNLWEKKATHKTEIYQITLVDRQ